MGVLPRMCVLPTIPYLSMYHYTMQAFQTLHERLVDDIAPINILFRLLFCVIQTRVGFSTLFR